MQITIHVSTIFYNQALLYGTWYLTGKPWYLVSALQNGKHSSTCER